MARTRLPRSRVRLLLVVTVMLEPLPAGMITVADGLKLGTPKLYPVGGVGRVGSLTVQDVPVGRLLMVAGLPTEMLASSL